MLILGSPQPWHQNGLKKAFIAICGFWRANSTPSPHTSQVTVSSVGLVRQPAVDLTGTTGRNGGINFPQSIVGASAVDGEDAWWTGRPVSQASGCKVEWTGYAQNNILTPYHLGEPTCMGSSAWEPLCTGVIGSLAEAVSSGLGLNNTRERRTDLQSKLQSLKATLVSAELIIGPKEAIELKSGRKQEPATRRRLTPSLSTYPWCQAFGVGEGSVAGQDSTTLGRQLAVALRADGAASLSSLDELVRHARATMFQVSFNQFDAAWKASNAIGVLAALEAYKAVVKETLIVAFNDALLASTTYPDSILLLEVCAGRSQQVKYLHTVWEQLTGKAPGDESRDADRDLKCLMGATKCLFDGARASTSVATTMRSAFEETGNMFSVAGVVAGNSGGPLVVTAPVQGAAAAASPPAISGGAGGAAAAAASPQQKRSRTRGITFQVHMPASSDVIGTSSGSLDQDSHVGHAGSQGTRPASARSPTERQARPCQDGTRKGTRCLQNGTGTNPKGLLTGRG